MSKSVYVCVFHDFELFRYICAIGLNKMYSYIVIISSTNKYRKQKYVQFCSSLCVNV